MSAHKFRLSFSTLAQQDVDDILAYTLENWGSRQVTAYKGKIDNALNIITSDPGRGKKIESGLLMFLVEKHKIFYRIENKAIIVVRILDQRMDEGRHLQ